MGIFILFVLMSAGQLWVNTAVLGCTDLPRVSVKYIHTNLFNNNNFKKAVHAKCSL